MRATIDSAGRLVVPKPLRDAIGLKGGESLELEVHDGRLEAEVVPTPMKIVGEGRHVHAVPADGRDMPQLTAEEVRAVLERTRDWPR